MKRREALLALFSSAGALGGAAAPVQDLSEETVRQMLRSLGGLEPLPAEAAHVRAFLLSMRALLPPEPGVEPAISFDPEMDR